MSRLYGLQVDVPLPCRSSLRSTRRSGSRRPGGTSPRGVLQWTSQCTGAGGRPDARRRAPASKGHRGANATSAEPEDACHCCLEDLEAERSAEKKRREMAIKVSSSELRSLDLPMTI